MNVVVLGWGSLIWCPRNLNIKTPWRLDGPVLPIEFARISQDKRLTLVINNGSPDQQTYWSLSGCATLDGAKENLCEREGSSPANIHHALRDGVHAKGASPDIVRKIKEWLVSREGLDAAIWTGLPSNWKKKRGRAFMTEDAVTFLSELEAARDQATATYNRAREYVTNAPPHIDTAVRRAMRDRGWKDATLPTALFEAPPPKPGSS